MELAATSKKCNKDGLNEICEKVMYVIEMRRSTEYKSLSEVTYMNVLNDHKNKKSAHIFEHLKYYKSLEAISLRFGWIRELMSIESDIKILVTAEVNASGISQVFMAVVPFRNTYKVY